VVTLEKSGKDIDFPDLSELSALPEFPDFPDSPDGRGGPARGTELASSIVKKRDVSNWFDIAGIDVRER